MLLNLNSDTIHLISNSISLLSIGVVVYGVVIALYHFFRQVFNRGHHLNIDQIRLEFGRDLLLALELFVAADLIRSAVTPDIADVAVLAILVLIRTVLSYFITRELDNLKPEARKKMR